MFKPMLAKDADLDKWEFPLVAQEKLDGIRCVIVDGKPVSRTLKPIPNKEIAAALTNPAFEGLDGEIIVGDPTADGCMQATSSFVMAPNKTGEAWAFYVFDKWNQDGPFWVRYGEAEKIVNTVTWTDLPLFMVNSRNIFTLDDLDAYEAQLLAAGHEGVILRVPDAPYKFGRAGVKGPLGKLKRFIDFEAEILGVYEEQHNGNEATKDAFGRTERSTKKAGKIGKGTLGGFELRAINGPHEGEVFRCGTGFTREQRAALWAEAFDHSGDGLNGKIVKVKSFPVGVKDKPRFPTFLGFRDMEIDG